MPDLPVQRQRIRVVTPSADPPLDGERRPIAHAESEQSVLGGLLLDNSAMSAVTGIISIDDFYFTAHRLIFRHIAELIEHGKPADALTVAESLERSGKLAEVGGTAYLGSLALNTPSAANIRRYAEIVRERAVRRELAAFGATLQEHAAAPGVDVAALTADAQSQLAKIESTALTRDASTWPDSLDLAALSRRDPEAPRFIVPDWLPCGYATLFAGHGGVGKSAIALHLAVCIALGIHFAGIAVERRRVRYLSCEDREGVLHWRLARICAFRGVSIACLAGWLDIVELVGHDSVLWERDPRTGATVTPAYGRLAERVRATQAEVLVVDSVTDVFAGNENARSDVKRFVNSVVALVPPERGAVLLIGHVAKPSAMNAATTEGYSGSTGWHNSTRARWYLYPESQRGDADDRTERTGRLILELQKSNLGPADQSMRWSWDDDDHLFLPEAQPTAFDRQHQQREERRGILLALKACADSGIVVPAAMTGPRTGFNVLQVRPEFPITMRGNGRAGARRFWHQIEQMRQLKLIEEVEYRRKNRHGSEQLVLTQEGMRQCA